MFTPSVGQDCVSRQLLYKVLEGEFSCVKQSHCVPVVNSSRISEDGEGSYVESKSLVFKGASGGLCIAACREAEPSHC